VRTTNLLELLIESVEVLELDIEAEQTNPNNNGTPTQRKAAPIQAAGPD
jgi:hypothetical protein